MYKLFQKGIAQKHDWGRFRPLCLLAITAILFTACGGRTVTTKLAAATPTPRSPVVARNAFSSPITYVALGASDAVGVGSNQPDSQGYVPLITAHLPKGSHTLNLGISGIHLRGALSQELPLALNTVPQLITIWLVVNDFVAGVSYQSYISDLDSLLGQLRSRTQARIVIANLPDLTRLPTFRSQTPTQKTHMLLATQQWNEGIAQVAVRYETTLVNLFQDGSEITAHPEYISGDGFHPSAKGYVRLAELFWQAVLTA